MDIIEKTVLHEIFNNKSYAKEILPHLDTEFFTGDAKEILRGVKSYIKKYNDIPNPKEYLLFMRSGDELQREAIKNSFKGILKPLNIKEDVIYKETEEFIRNSLYTKSLIIGAEAVEEKNDKKRSESFKIAEEAIKFSLDMDLGVSMYDSEKIMQGFKKKEGVKTGIKSFDKMIGKGYQPKTLHSVMAPSGVGKTAALATFACAFARQGKDVVICTLEMDEYEYFKRVYANLLEIDIELLENTNQVYVNNKIKQLKAEGYGNIIIKEYPAGSLSAMGVENYLDKVIDKYNINDPIVMVDYLGLMNSDRVRKDSGSYQFIGSIAEELRGLMQKRNLIGFSPMQLNRSSIGNLEADQSSLSESMKVYMTLDSAFLILQTEEMKQKGDMKIFFTKNRMSGRTGSFMIGYDYKHFKFIDKYLEDGENVTTHTVDKDDILRPESVEDETELKNRLRSILNEDF